MICQDQLDSVQSMMKTRKDNNVTGLISVISVEYETKLSRPMRQCAVYHIDEIGQRCD